MVCDVLSMYVCVICNQMIVKPATGRSCVPAVLLSGTVPSFTCDCLRFYAATKVRPVSVYVFKNNACIRKYRQLLE